MSEIITSKSAHSSCRSSSCVENYVTCALGVLGQKAMKYNFILIFSVLEMKNHVII